MIETDLLEVLEVGTVPVGVEVLEVGAVQGEGSYLAHQIVAVNPWEVVLVLWVVVVVVGMAAGLDVVDHAVAPEEVGHQGIVADQGHQKADLVPSELKMLLDSHPSTLKFFSLYF